MKELSFDKLYVKFSNLYCEYRSRKQFLKWLKSSKNLSEELFEVTPSEGNALFCQGMEEIEDAFYFISMPINCDESKLKEKEIPEEFTNNND